MRLLLDTHVWLWLQLDPERLGAGVEDLLLDPRNDLLLSAVSVWEIVQKYALGKLALPDPPGSYIPTRLAESGVLPLEITYRHVLTVSDLPLHHRDPFDRLLVAQARTEDLQLVTGDRVFAAYDVEVVWAEA